MPEKTAAAKEKEFFNNLNRLLTESSLIKSFSPLNIYMRLIKTEIEIAALGAQLKHAQTDREKYFLFKLKLLSKLKENITGFEMDTANDLEYYREECKARPKAASKMCAPASSLAQEGPIDEADLNDPSMTPGEMP